MIANVGVGVAVIDVVAVMVLANVALGVSEVIVVVIVGAAIVLVASAEDDEDAPDENNSDDPACTCRSAVDLGCAVSVG